MSNLLPRDLIDAMLETATELDAANGRLVIAAREGARADSAYKKAWATAYLKATGSIPEREAQADLAAAEERYAFKMAEGVERSALEAVRSVRQKLSALQSVSTSVKAELDLAKYGPGAA